MKNLSKLLPAQTLFITRGEHAQLKELLKLTFMDLLLKKVLKVTDLTRQANAKDKPITNTYVEIGANYNTHLPLPFEEGLLSTFAKDKDQTILLRHFIKIGYLNAKSTANFQKQIYNTSELDGIFKRSWFQTIFGGFTYTDWGSEFQEKLRHELELLDEELPSLINERNPKAWDILKVIKGNVFLLEHVDFELLTKLDRSLISEMNKEQNSYSGDFFSDMIWIGTDSYNADFDSGCGSDGGDGGGCSGCGGCGGCGGCS